MPVLTPVTKPARRSRRDRSWLAVLVAVGLLVCLLAAPLRQPEAGTTPGRDVAMLDAQASAAPGDRAPPDPLHPLAVRKQLRRAKSAVILADDGAPNWAQVRTALIQPAHARRGTKQPVPHPDTLAPPSAAPQLRLQSSQAPPAT